MFVSASQTVHMYTSAAHTGLPTIHGVHDFFVFDSSSPAFRLAMAKLPATGQKLILPH